MQAVKQHIKRKQTKEALSVTKIHKKFKNLVDDILSQRSLFFSFDKHHWFSVFGNVFEHMKIPSYLLFE